MYYCKKLFVVVVVIAVMALGTAQELTSSYFAGENCTFSQFSMHDNSMSGNAFTLAFGFQILK